MPREENMEVAHEKKKTKNDTLRMGIEMKRCRCTVLPVEMGCRENASRTLIAYLRIGLGAAKIKRTTKRSSSCSRVSLELDLAGITPLKVRHSPGDTYSC